LNYRLP
jgi:hypothetical protein